jgi:hypothetical protein
VTAITRTASFPIGVLAIVCQAALAPQPALAQQSRGQAGAPKETPPPATTRVAAPQGFSVVLVLGDLQASAPTDDVPLAARKALTDMKDFLPFKSYRLLDAAWLMCCGQESRRAAVEAQGRRTPVSTPSETISQNLRGPDGQEYVLKLSTSRVEGARVFVRFVLESPDEIAADADVGERAALVRAIMNEESRRALAEKLLLDGRKRLEVGTLSPNEVTRLELEVKNVERRIDELKVRQQRAEREERVAASNGPRTRAIDTSFTMEIGETVVVGTSRLKGGTKALIALLTAVPPRSGAAR